MKINMLLTATLGILLASGAFAASDTVVDAKIQSAASFGCTYNLRENEVKIAESKIESLYDGSEDYLVFNKDQELLITVNREKNSDNLSVGITDHGESVSISGSLMPMHGGGYFSFDKTLNGKALSVSCIKKPVQAE